MVLIGEHTLTKEEIDFITVNLPALHSHGVNLFAVEFLRAADQTEIDHLMIAPQFDQNLASDLIFRSGPLWGYQEYLDLLKAAWKLNTEVAKGQLPFRVIGLAISLDFSLVKNEEEFKKPDVWHRILSGGIPDQEMAAKVLEVLGYAKNGTTASSGLTNGKVAKLLVYVRRMSAASRWGDGSYAEEMKSYGYEGEERMGKILKARLGEALTSLIFYSPVPFHRTPFGESYPDNGLIDTVLTKLSPEKTSAMPVALDLTRSEFGRVDCSQTDLGLWASSHKKAMPVLKDLADSIVIFSPIRRLHVMQPIPDFANASNLAAAYKYLPAYMNHGAAGVAQLNDSVQQRLVDYRKVLDSFK